MYALIVVDYNTMDKTCQYLMQCMNRFKNIELFHAVIVDNSDDDKNIECWKKYFKEGILEVRKILGKIVYVRKFENVEIAYCRADENLGYARGNNLGTQISDELFDDDYYIISNNDLIFFEDINLTQITNIFKMDEKIGVIGPTVLSLEGNRQSPRIRQTAFEKLIKYYWVLLLGNKKQNSTSDIDFKKQSGKCDWVMGCFMFVRAKAFREICRFDPNTFLFAEELILSNRMKRKSYFSYYYNGIDVIHNHSMTIKNAISIKQNLRTSFASNYYYYETYENTSKLILFCAKMNFFVYLKLFGFKQIIKKRLKKN